MVIPLLRNYALRVAVADLEALGTQCSYACDAEELQPDKLEELMERTRRCARAKRTVRSRSPGGHWKERSRHVENKRITLIGMTPITSTVTKIKEALKIPDDETHPLVFTPSK